MLEEKHRREQFEFCYKVVVTHFEQLKLQACKTARNINKFQAQITLTGDNNKQTNNWKRRRVPPRSQPDATARSLSAA